MLLSATLEMVLLVKVTRHKVTRLLTWYCVVMILSTVCTMHSEDVSLQRMLVAVQLLQVTLINNSSCAASSSCCAVLLAIAIAALSNAATRQCFGITERSIPHCADRLKSILSAMHAYRLMS
jgi:hypothetical protein